jgi:hypothetical protein
MDKQSCKYRKWGWHDGGPEYMCLADGVGKYCCDEWYSDWYDCGKQDEKANEGLKPPSSPPDSDSAGGV